MKGAKNKGTKLPDEIFDESSRLLKCQRENLKRMKETYDISYADLARQYNISKSTAYYICNPGAAEKKVAHWLKVHKKYYQKEKAVAASIKSRKKIRLLVEKFSF